MKKISKRKEIVRSITEFEKKYFPKSYEKRISDELLDFSSLEANLAKSSLSILQQGLLN